jgi:hypothetical protein
LGNSWEVKLIEDLDSEVVEAVIIAKEGRVGVCIDICLEMSSGIQTTNPQTNQETKSGIKEDDTADLLRLGIEEINLEDGRNGRPCEPVNLMD